MTSKVYTKAYAKRKRRRKSLGRFRSQLEVKVAEQLRSYGSKFKYEYKFFTYFTKADKGVLCPNCGEVEGTIKRRYLPDFFLANGVVIEAKGRLTSPDRTKLKAIKEAHPDLDLRILFDYNRKLNKRYERYTDWADSIGLPWAIREVPEEWLLYSDQRWPRDVDSLYPEGDK